MIDERRMIEIRENVARATKDGFANHSDVGMVVECFDELIREVDSLQKESGIRLAIKTIDASQLQLGSIVLVQTERVLDEAQMDHARERLQTIFPLDVKFLFHDEKTKISVLSMQPGDMLVVRYDGKKMSQYEVAMLRGMVEKYGADHGVKVLCVDNGVIVEAIPDPLPAKRVVEQTEKDARGYKEPKDGEPHA